MRCSPACFSGRQQAAHPLRATHAAQKFHHSARRRGWTQLERSLLSISYTDRRSTRQSVRRAERDSRASETSEVPQCQQVNIHVPARSQARETASAAAIAGVAIALSAMLAVPGPADAAEAVSLDFLTKFLASVYAFHPDLSRAPICVISHAGVHECKADVIEPMQDQVQQLGPWQGPAFFIIAVICAEMIPLFPTQPLALSSGLLFGTTEVIMAKQLPWRITMQPMRYLTRVPFPPAFLTKYDTLSSSCTECCAGRALHHLLNNAGSVNSILLCARLRQVICTKDH